MADSQQILKKKILKFEDLETRFRHVEKIWRERSFKLVLLWMITMSPISQN
jgi:hypothetical protein